MVEPAGKDGLLADAELPEPPLGLSSPPQATAKLPMASAATSKASLNIESGFMGLPSLRGQRLDYIRIRPAGRSHEPPGANG
jgi:hypothetical protein